MELSVYEMIYEPFEKITKATDSSEDDNYSNAAISTLTDDDIGDSVSLLGQENLPKEEEVGEENNDYGDNPPGGCEGVIGPETGDDVQLEEDQSRRNRFMQGTCKFKCSLCDYTTSILSPFWDHVQHVHNMAPEIYKGIHGDSYIEEANKIECVKCFKIVLHEPGALAIHCRDIHGLDPNQFYDEYYADSDAKGSENVVKEHHIKEDDGPLIFETWWSSGIRFDCKICGKEHTTAKKLVKHLKAHDSNERDYVADFGQLQTKEKTFLCQVCNQKMPFGKTIIHRHLSPHSLSPKAYFHKFIETRAKTQEEDATQVVDGGVKIDP